MAYDEFLNVKFSNVDSEFLISEIIAHKRKPFLYIVTPNLDHIYRFNKKISNLDLFYKKARYIVNDSRIIYFLSKILRREIGWFPGSDIAQRIFEEARLSRLRFTIIGGDSKFVKKIIKEYSVDVCHLNPTIGFYNKNDEVHSIIEFIVKNKSDIILFCVGSPQQEMLAHMVYRDGRSVGFGLPVGAALEFLSGKKSRSPRFLRFLGLEWLFRLIQEPRRLWRRYILQVPFLSKVILKEIIQTYMKRS